MTDAIPNDCPSLPQTHTLQTRSRAHESPPPAAKRRRSSPIHERRSTGPEGEDNSLEDHTDNKRDIRVSPFCC